MFFIQAFQVNGYGNAWIPSHFQGHWNSCSLDDYYASNLQVKNLNFRTSRSSWVFEASLDSAFVDGGGGSHEQFAAGVEGTACTGTEWSQAMGLACSPTASICEASVITLCKLGLVQEAGVLICEVCITFHPVFLFLFFLQVSIQTF